MPTGALHNGEHSLDEAHRHLFVKKIAHAIHENLTRTPPLKRSVQHVLVEGHIKAVPVIMLTHRLEAIRKPFRIAVLAAGADLCAPGNWVPGGIRPFDMRRGRH